MGGGHGLTTRDQARASIDGNRSRCCRPQEEARGLGHGVPLFHLADAVIRPLVERCRGPVPPIGAGRDVQHGQRCIEAQNSSQRAHDDTSSHRGSSGVTVAHGVVRGRNLLGYAQCSPQQSWRANLSDIGLPEIDHAVAPLCQVNEAAGVTFNGLDLDDSRGAVRIAGWVAVVEISLTLHHDAESGQVCVCHPSANPVLRQEVDSHAGECRVGRGLNRRRGLCPQSMSNRRAQAGARAIQLPMLERWLVVPSLRAFGTGVLNQVSSLKRPRLCRQSFAGSGAVAARAAVRLVDDVTRLDHEDSGALLANQCDTVNAGVGRLGVAQADSRAMTTLRTVPLGLRVGVERRRTHSARPMNQVPHRVTIILDQSHG